MGYKDSASLVVMTNGDTYAVTSNDALEVEKSMVTREASKRIRDLKTNKSIIVQIHNVSSVVDGGRNAL